MPTADLDWSECALVEVIPGKVSGAPLLKNTRLPVEAITHSQLSRGASIPGAALKILFDEDVPGKLARSLPRHEIPTAVTT